MTTIQFPRFNMAAATQPLEDLEKGIKAARANGGKIEGQAKDLITNFTNAMERGEWFRPSFANAIRDVMSDQDGRYYPWGLTDIAPREPGRVRESAKNVFDRANNLAKDAGDVDVETQRLKTILDAHKADKKLSSGEAEHLSDIVTALLSSATVLTAALDARAKLGGAPWENLEPKDINDRIKTKVNKQYNDIQGGPFGLVFKFNEREAKAYINELKTAGVSESKAQQVMRVVYQEAQSEWGNLAITSAAAKAFAARCKELNMTKPSAADWNSAVDKFNDDHPIVALYAVAIREEMDRVTAAGSSADLSTLESMLRSGRAAVNELGVSFVRNGPRTVDGQTMPVLSAALAGEPARGARAQQLSAVSQQLDALDGFLTLARAAQQPS